KELRAGATANLVLLTPGSEGAALGTVLFLLSARSAYVDGQVFRIGVATSQEPADAAAPLAGKVAVVTGAARGIGADIARTLARDGARVVCVDMPSAGASLAKVANSIGGSALQADVTSPDAGARIMNHARTRHGGLDIVVHNAGITRDKLLANTDAERWGSVLAVNLTSILAMNEQFLARDGLRDGGHVVLVSSIAGIAGNRGQANYAASKAGVIGLVDAYAADKGLRKRGITANAVAPGFIETEMTARIPFATRELGRRLNSLAQGGLPIDVAETIAHFASDAQSGVNGNVVRVCGQSLLGA
ncbi:MAG TPA: 3-oxoacyl-ACP reductase, partial [Ornithinibacter sp.]|nr:3-oxoacyl-ACP reductase [Ornithinibacter sp.]